MSENQVLTAEDVAAQLKIAKNTVYELIKRGELRSYKVGRKVRIDQSDLDTYIQNSKNADEGNQYLRPEGPSVIRIEQIPDTEPALIISGKDSILDMLANNLQNHPQGSKCYRSHVCSFQGLTDLYYDRSHLVATHLLDGDNDEYNVSYVKYLVPGIPCVIIHLAKRVQGFYVKKGNPKNIHSWVDLIRDDVTFINREKGSGTRVLLDQKIQSLKIDARQINGYYNELNSHYDIANQISKGMVDTGVGSEPITHQLDDIDFIPLETEHYDLVMKKENLEDPTYKLIYDLLTSHSFIDQLSRLKGYDLSDIGQIVAET